MSQFPEEQSETGEFERQEDAFRDGVKAPDTAKPGRFHLYVSLACPWAHRTLIVRKLLKLDTMVGVTIADPVRDERGWTFGEGPGHSKDLVNGFSFLAEAYQRTDPKFSGRVTVPVLWDNEARRIVNNSEDDICRMFAADFAGAGAAGMDLFPKEIAREQADLSQFIYENINNGVYRAGFAGSQKGYDRAASQLFAALDELEGRLAEQRFLFGRNLVETDLRLFCTLIRFDAVYHGHFKCNVRRIVDYPHLFGYLRDLYQHPDITGTVNFDHIKRHYYVTHEDINPSRIVPLGPDLTRLSEPHGRGPL